jgi:diaminopimelate epimerase
MKKFTKMEGLGNDYVYMDATNQEIDNISDLAQFVSDRHFGIGSDGLILICKSDIADFKMRMFNSDGSESEMCGNGIRCVGKYVYDKGLTNKEIVTIETLAGIKTLKLNVEQGKVKTVRVDMGIPILSPKDIPVISDEKPVKNLKITVETKEFNFTCVSMGNPHAITEVENVSDFDVEKYGKIIEVNPMFPNKTNVEFVQILDRSKIKMRVWERGTGETLACGTGACATAVACIINDLVDRHVYIELLRRDFRNRMEQTR